MEPSSFSQVSSSSKKWDQIQEQNSWQLPNSDASDCRQHCRKGPSKFGPLWNLNCEGGGTMTCVDRQSCWWSCSARSRMQARRLGWPASCCSTAMALAVSPVRMGTLRRSCTRSMLAVFGWWPVSSLSGRKTCLWPRSLCRGERGSRTCCSCRRRRSCSSRWSLCRTRSTWAFGNRISLSFASWSWWSRSWPSCVSAPRHTLCISWLRCRGLCYHFLPFLQRSNPSPVSVSEPTWTSDSASPLQPSHLAVASRKWPRSPGRKQPAWRSDRPGSTDQPSLGTPHQTRLVRFGSPAEWTCFGRWLVSSE